MLVVVFNVIIVVAVQQIVDVAVDGIVVHGVHQMFDVVASCCFQCLDCSCCSSSC